MVKECQFTMAALSKLLPTSAEEFDDFKVAKGTTASAPKESPDADDEFSQALELNATEAEMTRVLEVKNERLNQIELSRALRPYQKLVHLDISMNKIAAVQGGFEGCPNLKTLIISDNLIKDITPFMFQKCKQLRSLNLDINQISRIANLHNLTNLQELSM